MGVSWRRPHWTPCRGKASMGGLAEAGGHSRSDHAIAILEARQVHAAGGEWVFPGGGRTGHPVEAKRAWAGLLKRAGIADLIMPLLSLRRVRYTRRGENGCFLAAAALDPL